MQEVIRIKNEHPDDAQCIVNDRVEGRLKVIRAFGAGFLKKVSFKILCFNAMHFYKFVNCVLLNYSRLPSERIQYAAFYSSCIMKYNNSS